MKTKSVELLNKGLADELRAIHQYLFFHFHCEDQGLTGLAALFKKTALSEMMHCENLAERVLVLKGELKMDAVGAVEQITTVREMLERARDMETQSVAEYNAWANECSAQADAASRRLFEDLVKQEEQHAQQFDLELSNIRKYGPHYLVLQSYQHEFSSASVKEHP